MYSRSSIISHIFQIAKYLVEKLFFTYFLKILSSTGDPLSKYCFVDRENAHSIWSLIDNIASALISQSNQVFYFRFCDQSQRVGRTVPHGVKVIDIFVPVKRSRFSLITQHRVFTRALSRFLTQECVDVLHTHFAIPSIVSRWMGEKAGVPVILSTQHELYGSMNPYLRLGLRITQHYCDAVVYVSEQVEKSYHPISGLARRELVIKNGINLLDVQLQNSSLSDFGNSPHIICAGRFVPVKGQLTLLEALPKVLESFPAARLCLAGDGPDKSALHARCQALGIIDSVEFPGWLPKDEMLDRAEGSSLMVVPSDGSQEGFGLVVAEAMALGVPLVCTDIPVFREVAGDTVCYFPVADADILADVIVKVLSHPESTNRRVNKALQRVEKYFDQRDMVDQYLSLYKDLLREKN
ncbi:Glycosyltransferase involved in cell wall bisynthesis [Franzmannia pantelleriensis]|uniref:Glycosyltransferase involved in cell wall bisynthesis n=2 Tax=Franzmannia pantelleriensis TaxID=48727 RepID=A0A1G9ESR1_9GAMM|nr:Glycosyltransferase involved in cell wall bisynthesis [Halomonas pantelleriensis]